jgi:hypothetical protein
MIAPSPRPKNNDVADRVLALLAFMGLFSFFGFLLTGMFHPAIADAERPIWEQARKVRKAEVTGLVLGAIFGAVLHYFYFRCSVNKK